MLVNINSIKIKKRVRKDLGDLEALKESMRRYGLISPILITQKKELVAGHRRLEAAKILGWININASIIDTANDVTLLEIELEENNQRLAFSDNELLNGYKHLKKLKNPSIFIKIIKKIKKFLANIFKFLFSKK
ncbi:MAG: ParB N-terminal domain-containing protein [Treponemataceae bacterium]